MLHKSAAMSECLLLVLNLGLISCQSRSKTVADQWNPAGPTLQLAGAPEPVAADQFNRQLSLTDQISFLGPHGEDQGIQRILVHSACGNAQAAQSTQDSTIRGRQVFALEDIVPMQLMLKAQSPNGSALTCRFDFILENQIGSTRKRHLNQAQIQISPINDLRVFYQGQALSAGNPPVVDASLLKDVSLPDWEKSPGHISFICEDFQLEQDVPDLGAVDFSQFAQQRIADLTGPDPRLTNAQQECRMFVRGPDSHRQMGPEMVIRFTPPSVLYQLEALPMNDYLDLSREPIRIYKLSLTNPNSIPVSIQLPPDPRSSFAFQITSQRDQTGYYQPVETIPFLYYLPSTDEYTKPGSPLSITLPPTSAQIVEIRVRPAIPFFGPSTVGSCMERGYRYEIRPEMQFTINQLARASGDSPVVRSIVYASPARGTSVNLLLNEILAKGFSRPLVTTWAPAHKAAGARCW